MPLIKICKKNSEFNFQPLQVIVTSLLSPKYVSESIERHLEACLIKNKRCTNGECFFFRLIRPTNLQGGKIRFQVVAKLDHAILSFPLGISDPM